MEVYRIITLPLPLLNNKTTNLCTMYKPSTYLAVMIEKNYYFEMSREDFKSCSGNPIKHCNISMIIRTSTYLSCAFSIFNNNIVRLMTICDSSLMADNNITQQFIPLIDDFFFVMGLGNGPAITNTAH